jgi:hypothetical protein
MYFKKNRWLLAESVFPAGNDLRFGTFNVDLDEVGWRISYLVETGNVEMSKLIADGSV